MLLKIRIELYGHRLCFFMCSMSFSMAYSTPKKCNQWHRAHQNDIEHIKKNTIYDIELKF